MARARKQKIYIQNQTSRRQDYTQYGNNYNTMLLVCGGGSRGGGAGISHVVKFTFEWGKQNLNVDKK